ncbi:ATP-binding protein, partial [Bacillus sp. JJ1127]
EPFYSLKEKGTGLGLMMCYKIIEEHHGKLKVSSELNKGTTVEVRLPIFPAQNNNEVEKE